MTTKCPKCNHDLGIELYGNYDIIGEKVICLSCKTSYEIEYEDYWDGEEETCSWELQEVKSSTQTAILPKDEAQ